MGDITVEDVGKAYRLYPGRWSRVAEWLFPALGPRHRMTWVLNSINFTIRSGESLGIVGINGAGKSTLLKIISGTIRATTGTVTLSGRVAALLELGMGFHPDFTGRQNVFMAAQLLGLQDDMITDLMPEIEAFAEIGAYIDQPVRVYSSGMQMRLAFSVATAVRPDILIVDEALSVGDSYFQHKSFDRIRKFRELGTTLLLVSHDKAAILSICDKVLLLNNGTVAIEGKPEVVMDYYNAIIADRGLELVEQSDNEYGVIETRSGTGAARLTSIVLLDEQHRPVDQISVGQNIILCLRIATSTAIDELVVGYQIKDRFGQILFGTNTAHLDCRLRNIEICDSIEYKFHFCANLGVGSYSFSTALHAGENHLLCNYEWRDFALLFEVTNPCQGYFIGTNWLPPIVECSMS